MSISSNINLFGDSPDQGLNGHWIEQLQLKNLFYGVGCVRRHLIDVLPAKTSKVLIITGNSIATKTPLISELEELLGDYHGSTFAGVTQHGPIADVERASEEVARDPSIDTLLSVGGGSPIDTAKTISYRVRERTGSFLTHVTIPTTLSAAECTAGGGYTGADGVKKGFMDPGMGVAAIFYDPEYAKYTPKALWLSTGIRALDHAVESFYHPLSSEVPWKALSLWAVTTLFECLPQARDAHPRNSDLTVRLQLAAFASSGLKGKNLKGGMGLSHSLGHALGSPYGIAHGMTSCMTLAAVVAFKANSSSEADAAQIARLLPATGGLPTSNRTEDAVEVSRQIARLVRSLGLDVKSLNDLNVPKSDAPLIVRRALGGTTSGPLYDAVLGLVYSMYGDGPV